MANLTVRNIPEGALKLLRERAASDRRSLNNEIVVLLEQAVEREASATEASSSGLRPASQVRRWETLCGRWRDERSWQEIAADIASHRTVGREVAL